MAPKANEQQAKNQKPRDQLRVRALEALNRIRTRAAAIGADKLTDAEIQAEVDAVRAKPRRTRRKA